jgi:hypothetical protein
MLNPVRPHISISDGKVADFIFFVYANARYLDAFFVHQEENIMAKVVVTMPDSLLEEVNSAARRTSTNRSQFFREALTRYLKERNKMEFEALMAEGYQEMAEENIADATGYLGAFNGLEK